MEDIRIEVKGCLIEKKGRYYATVYYTIEGTRKLETKATGVAVSSHKKKVAKKFLDNFIIEKQRELDELVQKEMDNQKKHSFADCFERWLKEKEKVVDINTARGYQNKCKKLIEYFRERNIYIEDLKAKDLESYYTHALMNGRAKPDKDGSSKLSNRSVSEQASLIKDFLRAAVVQEIIEKNPAENVKIYYPTQSKLKKLNFMDYDQTKALLEYVKKEKRFEIFYDIIMLCVYFGFRRSELLGLRWKAIDFEKNLLEVNHTAVRVDSKTVYKDDVKCGDSHRFLPIGKEIKTTLLNIKERQKELGIYSDEQFVIVKENGEPYAPDYITKRFKKIVESCDIKGISKEMTFHGLRHTADSIRFEQGWSIEKVQQFLGHADQATTANIYTHTTVRWKNNHGDDLIPFFESSNKVPTE